MITKVQQQVASGKSGWREYGGQRWNRTTDTGIFNT